MLIRSNKFDFYLLNAIGISAEICLRRGLLTGPRDQLLPGLPSNHFVSNDPTQTRWRFRLAQRVLPACYLVLTWLCNT